MSKRRREEDEDRHAYKRQKPDHQHKQKQQPKEIKEIQFARDLQHLLSFRQDNIQQLRNGIASFKAFLESILYHKDEESRARHLSILREFLDSQRPADATDTERPFLGQLWQAWSFASQNNNDQLSTAISSIFALLLKTLSSLLDFREYGLLLCRTVLQGQHLRLVKRCLDAPKHKDFLISPCLRLLIEVTSFDGGMLAREVYKKREKTFDITTLRRYLGLVRNDVSEEEAKRRPAIRTLTIRYILTHLKYLQEGGKEDILKNRSLCTSLFHFLRDDPQDVVNEFLSITEQHVLKDVELPRSAKATLLVEHNLERVTEIATRAQEAHTAAEKAFAWLKAICTISSHGVLRTNGWYPPGTTKPDQHQTHDNAIDLGLDSIEFYDRDDRPNVRNTTLLAWIQTLRPHASAQERELVLTCFKSAPELVAAYFAEKTIQMEPKLSNTWIGYASFLFETLQLPVPEYFGNQKGWVRLPPQTNILIESVLPRPLTQKVLTRCLNQSSEVVSFFTVRLLVLALEKLSKIRSLLRKAADSSGSPTELWHEASERLLTRFSERCPSMKDIISTFRKVPDDDEHALQREAVTRLLRFFYDVMPLQAMEEQFDVSTPLTAALARSEANSGSSEVKELRTLELEHLLQIARRSPGMRWFSKQGSLESSPILSLLRIHSQHFENRQIRDLIFHVLSENDVVNSEPACDALVALLSEVNDYAVIGPFLDDCLGRAVRQPVKYLDYLDSIALDASGADNNAASPDQRPSNLVAVLLEQAPFVLERTQAVKDELMSWISHYIALSLHEETHSDILRAIQLRLAGLGDFNMSTKYNNLTTVLERVRLPKLSTDEPEQLEAATIQEVTIPFNAPPVESENHLELFKWAQKDLDMALEDGDIEALILCLCSHFPDIRAQALTQLYKLEDRILHSALEDKNPVYVLIGQLIETYEQHCLPKAEALPCLAGCFATHALRVQTEAAHFMYPKINMYLNKGSDWRISKLPNYWIENTARSKPEEDDAYWKEVQWVLDWLVNGLRTTADLEILRRAGVFENVMSLCSSASVTSHNAVKDKVLELLWRATFVDGGSTTIITRTGVLAWLEMVKKGGKSVELLLKRRILEICDAKKIEAWAGDVPEKL